MAKVGPVDAPLIPTMILVTGGYLMWFAVHYWRDVAQAYPSGPIKSVLTGKGVPAPVREGSPQDPNAETFTLIPALKAEKLGTSSLDQSETTGAAGAGAGAAAGTGATPGRVFTSAEMEQFWVQNGGDPARAKFAAGVMMAESGGRTDVTSSNPDGGTNVGLFQLDTPGGVGAGHTVEQLKDPTLNTQITIMATRNGTDWADWADSYTDVHGHKGDL